LGLLALFVPVLSILIMTGCEKREDRAPGDEETDKIRQERVITIVDDSTAFFTEPESKNPSDEVNEALSDLHDSSDDKTVDEAGTDDIPTYEDKSEVSLDMSWQYADYTRINSGSAVFYKGIGDRKNYVVGVNAGHGTKGGTSVKTYCHPDKTPKVTGGTTAAGSIEAVAVSGGMTFNDGTSEASVNLKMARALRDELLSRGYDVLMVRDGDDVQLDNVARTVLCNNISDCHIAIHWDGDGLEYDKGCFYISVPDGIKQMEPVRSNWEEHERLGKALISGLSDAGFKISGGGSIKTDLTQTSYSTIPSVDIELGNQSGDHSDGYIKALSVALADGVDRFASN
jgi:N-acetylmuramoyl-L-alanine amidase